MSVFNSVPPKINQIHLIKWLKSKYPFLKNRNFILKKLNSERDKNFLIKLNNLPSFVLKISNPEESKDLLLMQDFILDNLSKRISIKSFIPKKIHKTILTYSDLLGRSCYVRILHFVDGKMYALVKHNTSLEKSLGTMLGILSSELKNLNKPAAFRDFEWDPSNIMWLEKDLKLFNGRKKDILLKNINEHNFFVQNNKKNLRYSLTHGDANNYNLVVKKNKVVGLLDYGDMIYAPTINDLAIALSYALMNKNDLYSSLENIVKTYHNRFKINFDEIFSLMTLVKTRLSITVVMAEKQKKKFPQNDYLSISKNDAWKLLCKLNDINPYLLIFLIRNFCDYQITENYNKIINFLKKNLFYSLLDFDLNRSYKDPNFNEENYNDPIDAFNARDRATKLHEEVVKKLALICSKKNLIIRDPVHIDFYTEYKSRGKLFEIKTFNKSNFKKQIRHAIIQVKEYYFKYAKFNEEILKETDLFILLNENPEEIIEREQIEFLQDQNITLCWLQNDKIETFNENKLAIKWLL